MLSVKDKPDLLSAKETRTSTSLLAGQAALRLPLNTNQNGRPERHPGRVHEALFGSRPEGACTHQLLLGTELGPEKGMSCSIAVSASGMTGVKSPCNPGHSVVDHPPQPAWV